MSATCSPVTWLAGRGHGGPRLHDMELEDRAGVLVGDAAQHLQVVAVVGQQAFERLLVGFHLGDDGLALGLNFAGYQGRVSTGGLVRLMLFRHVLSRTHGGGDGIALEGRLQTLGRCTGIVVADGHPVGLAGDG